MKHLIERDGKHGRGRPSRFLRGSPSQLVTLRKSARKKFVVFRTYHRFGLSFKGVRPRTVW